MKLLQLILFTVYSYMISSFRIVGWYNGDFQGISNIAWDKYTHIVTGFPQQNTNGSQQKFIKSNY